MVGIGNHSASSLKSGGEEEREVRRSVISKEDRSMEARMESVGLKT